MAHIVKYIVYGVPSQEEAEEFASDGMELLEEEGLNPQTETIELLEVEEVTNEEVSIRKQVLAGEQWQHLTNKK